MLHNTDRKATACYSSQSEDTDNVNKPAVYEIPVAVSNWTAATKTQPLYDYAEVGRMHDYAEVG